MKRFTSWLLALLIIASPVASVSAASKTGDSTGSAKQQNTIEIRVDTAPEATVYTLPSGKMTSDKQALSNELAKLTASTQGQQNIVMNINTYQRAEKINPLQVGGKALAYYAGWGFGFKIGSYYVRFSIEPGYVGGCIQKNVWHVGMMISKQGSNTPLIDLHLAGWKDKGGPQLGAYNSGSVGRFCTKTKLDYNQTWYAIDAAAAALLGGFLGGIVANMSAAATYSELLILAPAL